MRRCQGCIQRGKKIEQKVREAKTYVSQRAKRLKRKVTAIV